MSAPTDARTSAGQGWIRAWLGDSSLMLGAQALTVVATSVAAILVARTLAPEDWGVFSAFLGLSLALAMIVDFGLATWLLREFSRLAVEDGDSASRPLVGRTLSSALAINVGMGLPLWFAAAVWAAIRQPGFETTAALLALLAYGTLTASGSAIEAYLRSRREVRLVVGISLFEKTELLVVLAVVAALDGGLGWIGAAYLAAGLTRVALGSFLVFVRRGVPPARPRFAELRLTARSSVPFALTTASLNVVPRLDTLLLVALSATSAAWFAIGDRALGPALLVPATLGSTLYPFLAAPAARRTAPWRLAGVMGLGGVAVALVGVALAPTLVPAVFGSDYRDAVSVTQIMLLMVPIVYATSPLLVSAYSSGLERALVAPIIAISLLGSGAIVVGQLIFGPKGAAVGLLIRSLAFLAFIGSVAVRGARASTGRGDIHSLTSAQPLR